MDNCSQSLHSPGDFLVAHTAVAFDAFTALSSSVVRPPMHPSRQLALSSQPRPPQPPVTPLGHKRQKLSKYERKLAEEEEREAKWEQIRAQKRVESGQLILQPGSFPLFRPPLPPTAPHVASSGSGSGKWLSEGEKLALYRSLSYPPGSLPPPTPPFLALLDREIAQFVQSVCVLDDERQRKVEVLQRVKDALQPLWPTVDVQPFGSFPLDLSLPHSDVDAVLLIDTRREVAAELRDVQTVLTCMQHNSMPTFKLIARARVPILRYTDTDRGVKVDLCINATDGVRAVEAMRRYMQQHTEMRSLVLCLKLILRRAGVSEVYSGGVNSYILQLMTVFFLQMYHRAADGPAPSQQQEEEQQQTSEQRQQHEASGEVSETEATRALSKKRKHATQSADGAQSGAGTTGKAAGAEESAGRAGMLLYSFLDFYGHRFDYVNYGIQLGLPPSANLPAGRSCQYYSKLERGRLSADNPFLLSIEDPLDPTRDSGAGSFGILRVQRCMQLAQERLALIAAEWQHTGNITLISSNHHTQHATLQLAEEEEGTAAVNTDMVSQEAGSASEGGLEGESQLSRKERKKRKKARKESKKKRREEAAGTAAQRGERDEEEQRRKEEERMQLGPILTQLTTADLYVTPTLKQAEEERKLRANNGHSHTTAQQQSASREGATVEESESESTGHNEASTAVTPRVTSDRSRKDERAEKRRGKQVAGERVTRKQRRQLREAEAHARNMSSKGDGDRAPAIEQSKDEVRPPQHSADGDTASSAHHKKRRKERGEAAEQ